MCSISCCSYCCSVFSPAGIVILVILGLLFDNQPFFTEPVLEHEGHSDAAAKNCYIAAAIYAGTFVLSLIGIAFTKMKPSRRDSAVSDHELAPLASAQSVNYGQ
mmetsp:Transcript_12233/g.17261  ORF Transcript_12233/g.17261 Transcript_12233/m.17261 type:complete len:104 (+) Transcript_12233:86-397(+)